MNLYNRFRKLIIGGSAILRMKDPGLSLVTIQSF